MNTRIDLSPEDERAMSGAASWGLFIAIGSIIGVVVSAVSTLAALSQLRAFAFEMLIGPVISMGVNLTLSVLLFQACASFRRVALTDDDDQGFLLRGFSSLRYYFFVQVLVVILAVAGGGLIFGVLGFADGAPW